jgi:glycyl-tRNA synthetase alpha subunit
MPLTAYQFCLFLARGGEIGNRCQTVTGKLTTGLDRVSEHMNNKHTAESLKYNGPFHDRTSSI